ncbi:hypothetical protein [Nitratidesulfovibrio termitidis]|uniref:hypothetical protein n=1 Tax=Nitratidesulfovibrio termitidis TaxID=42252 RepID=UPI00054F1A91|nr:hypothetical protein [Nitratidesulfovibrio termitidis]
MHAMSRDARCAVCGSSFGLEDAEVLARVVLCPACAEGCSLHDRRLPMMFIEVDEHRRLLGLYHASHDEARHPTPETVRNRLRALEACNRFFEGGTSCR